MLLSVVTQHERIWAIDQRWCQTSAGVNYQQCLDTKVEEHA